MLTETDIRKMPEDDYMNEAQLEFFKHELKKMRGELLETIEDARSSLAETENNADPADVATTQEMQQLHLRTVERQSRLIHKIEKSLESIRNGEYGYCTETGDPIGIPRLLARPTANLSIQSKETQEYREKTEGEEA